MGWETTPITKGLFMDTIKLERNGKIVTRSKADYDLRGFKEPSAKPKPKPEPKVEKPKEEPKAEVKKDSEWEKEQPKTKKVE